MTVVFAYANGFLTARQGCRALQLCFARILNLDCHVACAPRNDTTGNLKPPNLSKVSIIILQYFLPDVKGFRRALPGGAERICQRGADVV